MMLLSEIGRLHAAVDVTRRAEEFVCAMISQANMYIHSLGFMIKDLCSRVQYLGFTDRIIAAVSMHVSCVQVSMKMAEGGDDYDALLTKMDKLQSAIDAIEGWELDRQLERAMQALRCPPGKLNNDITFCAFQLMMS